MHVVWNGFSIHTNVTVNNGMWHTILIKFNDTRTFLSVDDEEIHVEDTFERYSNIGDGLIYLGTFDLSYFVVIEMLY